jgi:hypothetical protein
VYARARGRRGHPSPYPVPCTLTPCFPYGPVPFFRLTRYVFPTDSALPSPQTHPERHVP